MAGNSQGLQYIIFPNKNKDLSISSGWTENPGALEDARSQLLAYFNGSRNSFSLKLAPRGTPFQLAVYRELRKVPYGSTMSYSEVARKIGRSGACRAVGAANARNPLPIVIPCHRVIGADGKLVGFGGGLETKRFLLELESKNNTDEKQLRVNRSDFLSR